MNSLQDIVIRPELKSEAVAVENMICRTFGNNHQSSLLGSLRSNVLFKRNLSLIALMDNDPKGHLLLFPGYLRAESGIYRTLTLVMISVLPDFQQQGIGSMLLAAGIDEARAGHFAYILVCGAPGFFCRAGFASVTDYNIHRKETGVKSQMLILETEPGSLGQLKGHVEFPELPTSENRLKRSDV